MENIPEFLDISGGKRSNFGTRPKKYVFHKPFNKESKPKKYLGLIVALLDGEPKTKIEVLKVIGKEKDEIDARGYYSDYFSNLQRTGILKYDVGTRRWYQGKNYFEYFAFILKELSKHANLRRRFSNMLVLLESNFIDFIIKDD